MTNNLIRLTSGILVAIMGLIVLHAPMIVWVETNFPDVGIGIKAWKEILLVISFILLVLLITLTKKWHLILKDRLVQLIGVYATLHIALLAWNFQGTQPAIAGLMIDLRGMLIFSEIYIMAWVFWPDIRRWMIKAVTVGAGVVAGFATLQLFLPRDFLTVIGYGRDTIEPYMTVDKNQDLIRYSSTLRGPNPLGAYAASGLLIIGSFIASLSKKLRMKFRWQLASLAICLAIALVSSHSRSAWLGFLFVSGVAIAYSLRTKVSKLTWVMLVAIAGALIAGLFVAREDPFVSTVFFHDNPSGSVVKSDDEHLNSLNYGVANLIEHPLGEGIGSTGSASLLGSEPTIVENQYLLIGHEAGWLGFGLFLLIFGLVLKKLYKNRQDWLSLGVFLAGLALGLVGLLLPVFADDTIAILWWGLAGVALGSAKIVSNAKKRSTNKKAARSL